MSYCRWSCEDYDCDIYAFFDVDGSFQVWVASNRYVSSEPKPKAGNFPYNGSDAEVNDFWTRYDALNIWVKKADSIPIGLPHDGEQFSFKTPGEAADKMEELRAMGYHVPQYAIDALRDEQKRLSS